MKKQKTKKEIMTSISLTRIITGVDLDFLFFFTFLGMQEVENWEFGSTKFLGRVKVHSLRLSGY